MPSSTALEIRPADPADPAVAALIELHLAGLRESTPPEFTFALDASGLAAPDVSLFAAWRGDALAGVGALREIAEFHGEIKSMRTSPDHLRAGVGQALVDHLVAVARERGYTRVSLETGTAPEFAVAIALYERNGFTPTGPFGDYAASDHNRFLTLGLGRERS